MIDYSGITAVMVMVKVMFLCSSIFSPHLHQDETDEESKTGEQNQTDQSRIGQT